MPNHITNIVKYEGDADRIKEMLEQIKVDEFGIGTIDFNKLIPMPESLNIESGSRTDRGLKAYKEFLEIYTFGRKVEDLDLLNIPAESEEKFLEIRKDVEQGDWELGKKAFQNAYQYGYSTWYEWSINNWGTKWNSYGYSEDMSYAEMDASRKELMGAIVAKFHPEWLHHETNESNIDEHEMTQHKNGKDKTQLRIVPVNHITKHRTIAEAMKNG